MALIEKTSKEYYEGEDIGGYKYVSLYDLVNNFMFAYVGQMKLIHKLNRAEAIFQIKRGIQQLSYDASKVSKAIELEVGSTLKVKVPQDFVSINSIFWVDENGKQHKVNESKTEFNPSIVPLQDSSDQIIFDNNGDILEVSSITEGLRASRSNYISGSGYVTNDYDENTGNSNLNPTYIENEHDGTITLSSNLVGKVILLRYISDSLGSDKEIRIHKFLEQALYMYAIHEILSSRVNVQEYIVRRYKKYASSELANAKIRMLNLNKDELIQTILGKNKSNK